MNFVSKTVLRNPIKFLIIKIFGLVTRVLSKLTAKGSITVFIDVKIFANGHSYVLGVSRNHLHVDAVCMQFSDGLKRSKNIYSRARHIIQISVTTIYWYNIQYFLFKGKGRRCEEEKFIASFEIWEIYGINNFAVKGSQKRKLLHNHNRCHPIKVLRGSVSRNY